MSDLFDLFDAHLLRVDLRFLSVHSPQLKVLQCLERVGWILFDKVMDGHEDRDRTKEKKPSVDTGDFSLALMLPLACTRITTRLCH